MTVLLPSGDYVMMRCKRGDLMFYGLRVTFATARRIEVENKDIQESLEHGRDNWRVCVDKIEYWG